MFGALPAVEAGTRARDAALSTAVRFCVRVRKGSASHVRADVGAISREFTGLQGLTYTSTGLQTE